MGTDTFVSWQFGMTLIAVLAVGIFMFMRARRSQAKRGEEPGQVTGTTKQDEVRRH